MTKDWAKHKELIVQYYIAENRTLREVREIMQRRHNFDASVRSYRQYFDLWNKRKYNRRGRDDDGSQQTSPSSSGFEQDGDSTSEEGSHDRVGIEAEEGYDHRPAAPRAMSAGHTTRGQPPFPPAEHASSPFAPPASRQDLPMRPLDPPQLHPSQWANGNYHQDDRVNWSNGYPVPGYSPMPVTSPGSDAMISYGETPAGYARPYYPAVYDGQEGGQMRSDLPQAPDEQSPDYLQGSVPVPSDARWEDRMRQMQEQYQDEDGHASLEAGPSTSSHHRHGGYREHRSGRESDRKKHSKKSHKRPH